MSLHSSGPSNFLNRTSFEDIFGGAPVSFSKDNHLGVSAATIGQIKNGRWVTIAKNQSRKSEKNRLTTAMPDRRRRASPV
ncbi:hypothetical protein [Bradyrhizobium diazoefficiens]|uniref:hypothetical protein n=1 Tax=Bradyrhizobium diazoefficiens TaxID=1355477 RepID=UPI001FEF05AA|nr:hypothetical protein [Bradyrhizobium diazoefficiens]